MSQTLRLVVDGGDRHTALPGGSPWAELAPWLGSAGGIELIWLDRGDAGFAVPASGVRPLPFPSHAKGACAADSLLLQRLCDHWKADAFAAAGWTTAVTTPGIQLVDARSCLPLPAHLPPQAQQERLLAHAVALQNLCSSSAVRARLLADHTQLPDARVAVAALDWQATRPAQWAPVLGGRLLGLVRQCRRVAAEPVWADWAREWARLRVLQATVDL